MTGHPIHTYGHSFEGFCVSILYLEDAGIYVAVRASQILVIDCRKSQGMSASGKKSLTICDCESERKYEEAVWGNGRLPLTT